TMALATFALCLTFLLVVAHMATLKQTLRLESVDVGKRVTLQCLCQDDVAVMFFWYKQILGKRPEQMCTFYKHQGNATFEDKFNHSRFSLDTGNQRNIKLKISDLKMSDSAIYYCVKSNIHEFEFCEGTWVTVKGSGLNIQTLVHESASEMFQSEGSMTLNCRVHASMCDAEHSVYRFKDGEESHPGLIYTQGGRNDQCGRNSNTHTDTCVYSLPTNVSGAGIHYCAVASCGNILFGNKTEQVFDGKSVPPVLIYLLSGALAFTTFLVVFLAFFVFKMSKRQSPQTGTLIKHFIFYYQLHQDEENIQYAAVGNSNRRVSRRETDDTLSECFYSSVKQ
uniref:Uncharacterized LOC108244256 n=1 Tax=Kryptolebias marmoratus TaxID=37003 RepID=A0A3Q3GII2_KRYMA